jgi:hypothetical protein
MFQPDRLIVKNISEVSARINACNNIMTTDSPCKTCRRINQPKNICCLICDRLHAYQRGDDWTKYSVPKKIPKNFVGNYNNDDSDNDSDNFVES